ncbi:MAG: chemotaxis protein CheW [Kofleriaceae bacterium]|nr:chemotaxis protein CheW [Kofleriaceae bacterium]
MLSDDLENLRDPDTGPPRREANSSTEHFVFRLSSRTYALPPRSVEMVIALPPIIPVPTARPHVRGVVHVRGRIIAVLDLAALIGLDAAAEPGPTARLVVVMARHPFAFVADMTLGIWAFTNDAQKRATDDGPMIAGQIEDRGGAATLLDPAAIVDHVIRGGAVTP